MKVIYTKLKLILKLIVFILFRGTKRGRRRLLRDSETVRDPAGEAEEARREPAERVRLERVLQLILYIHYY